MRVPSLPWRAVTGGVLIALTAVLAARLTVGLGGHGLASPGWKLLYNGLVAGCGVTCAVLGRRRGWVAIGCGLVLWAGGNGYWTFELVAMDEPPYPSLADLLFLLAYVPLIAGTWSLLRASRPRVPTGIALDALVAGLGAASIVTAYVLPRVTGSVGGGPLGAVVNLLYPLADVTLITVGIAVAALYRRQIPFSWVVLVGGFVTFGVADTTYLVQVAAGTYREGTLVDLGWPTAAVLIAVAALLPRRADSGTLTNASTWEIALPSAFALAALALLAYDHVDRVPLVSVLLASACVAAVVARMVASVHGLVGAAASSHADARFDVVTGLPNRRALLEALERSLAAPAPQVLVLLDLNGFKAYNDLFGHPAGDALLHRLAAKLTHAVRDEGQAFRMGGDEFCVVMHRVDDPQSVGYRLAQALVEEGDGFSISAAWGAIVVPDEATTVTDAIGLADQRMYANKTHGRLSPGEQSTHVLLAALEQRHETLGDHVDGVADLAGEVAAELGLSPLGVAEVRTAAVLHDIGKVAIPDAILHKPGPLDDEEWAFMHRHTIIGEKILDAAPALRGAARIVRASHERFDGGGYPDGLRGEEIPLGARIILACDAYDAIISDRPYSRARTTEEALDELVRNTGSQFDPEVVAAFARVMARRRVRPIAPTAQPTQPDRPVSLR